MKIDLNSVSPSQLMAELSPKQVPKDGQASGQISSQLSGQSTTEDRATLSQASASVQSLAHEALQSPAVRQDKVDALREAVSSGQYEINPAKIAAAIAENKG